ncbi:hypothetical protein [Micromonospora sp. NPDC023956]
MDTEAAAGLVGLLAVIGVGWAIWNHVHGDYYDDDDVVYYEEWYYEEWDE